ncbi:MAG: hypothetical protein RBR28_06880 [Lentimicrobium sp.]|jgi:hypothetical protein|nr:hypothetical protein [Lentimicrobium sp.]
MMIIKSDPFINFRKVMINTDEVLPARMRIQAYRNIIPKKNVQPRL